MPKLLDSWLKKERLYPNECVAKMDQGHDKRLLQKKTRSKGTDRNLRKEWKRTTWLLMRWSLGVEMWSNLISGEDQIVLLYYLVRGQCSTPQQPLRIHTCSKAKQINCRTQMNNLTVSGHPSKHHDEVLVNEWDDDIPIPRVVVKFTMIPPMRFCCSKSQICHLPQSVTAAKLQRRGKHHFIQTPKKGKRLRVPQIRKAIRWLNLRRH